MKCPDIGMLQAYIDGESDIGLKKNIESHLICCPKCSTAYRKLKGNDDFAFDSITKYKQYTDENFSPASRPFKAASVQSGEVDSKKGAEQFMSYFYKYRKIAAGICAALVITTCMSIQPVRAAVSNALSIFRVENVKGLNISVDDIQQIQNKLRNKEPEIDLQKFGKIKTIGGQQRQVTLEEAKKVAGLPVLFPAALADTRPGITVIDPSSMEFTLNVDNMNRVLKSFGAQTLLPKSIDGKTFNVNISRTIVMKYNISGRDINIVQTKSPEIVVPEGVDVDQIYDSMVDLPIIPENLQRQLKSIKDWKSTIYIPVIGNETTEVDINGSKGYVFTGNNVSGNTFSGIVWSDSGVIRSIQGMISKDEIVALARSMK